MSSYDSTHCIGCSICAGLPNTTRPVRILVGYPAGGTADIIARVTAQFLSDRLGQQFIVENRLGANASIAARAVVGAPPDGYTLLLAEVSDAINATLYDNLNYEFLQDMAPICSIGRVPLVMEVNPSVPAKTVPEFIAYPQAHVSRRADALQKSACSTSGEALRKFCEKSGGMAICCLPHARGKVNEWRGGASVPFAVVTWSASMKS